MHAITEFATVCEKAVRAAGTLLIERMGRVEVREKGPSDFVTEADLAAQDTVRQIVLGAFPDHWLVGEEDPASLAQRRPYRWIVDPLDGTMNYVHGIPFFAVSLALECQRNLLVGAVYHPHADECFLAVAGQGARLNGRPIRTSHASELDQALAMAGLPAQCRPDSPDLLVFVEASMKCQSVRRTGSAALNAAYVAAGRADAFWSFSTKVWDIAAGALLIREAGGVVTNPDGGDFDLDRAHFVATANPQLQRRFCQMVAQVLARK